MAEFGIPEFYAGQNVFITGGTGFIGKVLIEKILRCCPDVGKIYVLTRPKAGLTLKERWQRIYALDLFEKLRSCSPNVFETKVIPIAGDVNELNLGISQEDRKLLIEKVNIIYHAAASVRFDQPLRDAILLNTRGAREMCQLVLDIKNIKMFTHISTAYCHTQQKTIEEKMYPAYEDWRRAIEIAEAMDSDSMQVISHMYMEGFPNTYTFTKSMGENVVYDMLNGKVNAMIIRPTIVVSTRDDPISGWIDNFNGPVGILAACGTGLVRISLVNDRIRPDFIPVDIAVKGIMIGSWYYGGVRTEERLKTKVFNASSSNIVDVPIGEIINMGKQMAFEIPLDTAMWSPSTKITSNITLYYIYVMIFHLIPAVILDTALKLLKRKPMVVKVQRRIYSAMMALSYFVLNEWHVINDGLYVLEDEVLPKDKDDFAYNADTSMVFQFFRDSLIGAKKWLFKDTMDLDYLRRRAKIYLYLDTAVSYLSYAVFFYFIYSYTSFSALLDRFENYWDSLVVPV